MTSKRPRNFDYTKPLPRYENLEDFQRLTSVTEGGQTPENGASKKATNIPIAAQPQGKQKIDIPNISQTSDTTEYLGLSETEKKRKHQLGYIRIKQKENIPHLNTYELNENDMAFLDDYKLPATTKLSKEAFYQKIQDYISFLERQSGKNQTITWPQAQAVLEKQTEYDFKEFNQQQLQEFYIYWESQRKLYNRPLLRQYQHANTDDTNPFAAFRPRGSEKMKLRGKNKQNDYEQFQRFKALKEEFKQHDMLLKCIRAREHLKFEVVLKENDVFMEQVFQLDGNADFRYLGKFQCQNQQDYQRAKQEFLLDYCFNDRQKLIKQVKQEADQMLNKLKPQPPVPKPKTESQKQIKESQLEKIPNLESKFDIAQVVSSLVMESNIAPEDLFTPSTINEVKNPKFKVHKEKVLKNLQNQQQQALKMEQQQYNLKKQQEQQQQIMQQQMLQQKMIEQQQGLQQQIRSDILKNPYYEFIEARKQQQKILRQRTNTLTYNIYKIPSRGGYYQLYRSFDNLMEKDSNYLIKAEIPRSLDSFHGKKNQKPSEDYVVAKHDWQSTSHIVNKCERFIPYIRLEEELEENNQILRSGMSQDELFKQVKKNIKKTFSQFQKSKENNLEKEQQQLQQQQPQITQT